MRLREIDPGFIRFDSLQTLQVNLGDLLISVDWQGFLYNRDFNQAIGLPITGRDGKILTIEDLEAATSDGKELPLSDHCYCCTAGEGSSCTGALVA